MSALVPLLVGIPLIGAAINLVFGRRKKTQIVVSVLSLATVLVLGAILLVAVDTNGPIAVAIAGWQIPLGIVLYVDVLAALLVVVTAIVLLAVLLFSIGQGAADNDEDTPAPDPRPTQGETTPGGPTSPEGTTDPSVLNGPGETSPTTSPSPDRKSVV